VPIVTENPPTPPWAVDEVPGRPAADAAAVDGERWTGEVRSRLALPTTPYFAWMSLVAWTEDGGGSCWGEDHDSWSPRRWRALCRGEES
jgi:hypothetical protein